MNLVLSLLFSFPIVPQSEPAQSRPAAQAQHDAAAESQQSRPGASVFPPGKTRTDWMPMTLYLDRYIYLRGTLNGRVTDIVLDSGAGATVVDAALADEMGLESSGEVSARGVGGMQRASFLPGLEIRLGELTLRRIRAVRIDMSGVGRMLGRAMPVVLGKDAFQAAVVDLDYPNARIAFHDAAGFRYQGDGRTVPLVDGRNGHRQVEILIEGKKGLCTIDTGSGMNLSLFNAFIEEHDLLADRTPLSETQAGGVGGKILSKLGTLRSVTFAGFELKEVPATFGADKKGGAFDNDRLAGNLGAGIFGRFRLLFDYRRASLHVEPGPDWDQKAFRKDRIGLGAEWRDDALVVVFVPPGSPAAKAGLQPGDRITRLDGKAMDQSTWRETVLRHTNTAPGTEVRLTYASGRELRLVAADYY